MKKSISKIIAMATFLLLGSALNAQTTPPVPGCTGTVYIKNTSGISWTVNYYNQSITVQPDSDVTLGFSSASSTTTRQILLTSAPFFCNYTFQTSPDTWYVQCVDVAVTVDYQAVLTPSTGCYNSGQIVIY